MIPLVLITKTCVCVCVFIELQISAQSCPVILTILCYSHWSLNIKGGSNILVLRKPLFKVPCAPLSSSFLFHRYLIDILGRHLLNQHCLVHAFFSYRPINSLPRFPHRFYNSHFWSFLRFSASPPPSFPDYLPRLPSLGSGTPHDATVSLERRVLRLWLLVTVGVAPSLSRASSDPPLQCYHFAGSRALSPLHPPRRSRPRSRSRSCPHPYPVLVPVPVHAPVPVPVTVSPLPSLMPFTVLPSVPHRRTGAGSCARSCWLPAGATFFLPT